MPTIPHWLWLLWVLDGFKWLAWFFVIEGIAIANGHHSADTLSQIVWAARLPAVLFFISAGVVVFTAIWLMLHFTSGGKWGI
jgi:hypothetical protein